MASGCAGAPERTCAANVSENVEFLRAAMLSTGGAPGTGVLAALDGESGLLKACPARSCKAW